MKKLVKRIAVFTLVFVAAGFACACGILGTNQTAVAEKVTLENAALGEVEFANADTVNLSQTDRTVEISGTIDAMTAAQKSAFGLNNVTHTVALKIVFDKERTLSSAKVEGGVTKVYSDNPEDENYVGSLTDFLDSESGEDAYARLILSANTKNYKVKAVYSDGTESEIVINITATLADAAE